MTQIKRSTIIITMIKMKSQKRKSIRSIKRRMIQIQIHLRKARAIQTLNIKRKRSLQRRLKRRKLHQQV
jgi:hypothetical protein